MYRSCCALKSRQIDSTIIDDYSLYFDRLSRRLSREGRKKKKKKEIPVKMKQRPVCEIGNEGRAKGRKKVKKKKKKKKGSIAERS